MITALDSFFYFRRPLSELANFRRLLRYDGLLVLEMPVAKSRILRLSGTAGKYLSGVTKSIFEESDHLFYFSPESTERLLKRGGFKVKEIVMLPANRQDHWVRDLGYRAYWRTSQLLRAITQSKVFLGPRFLVAAEKS